MQELTAFLQKLDWSPLLISLKTGIVSTLVCFVLGILAAWRALYASPRRKAFWDSLLTLPMVLPPTAAGFLLLLLFSRRRPLGLFLENTFGIRIVQSFAGCVMAACVIAFPLMYRSVRAAFDQVDRNLIDAGRTLGMTEWEIFSRVVLPSARPGLISGCALSFARALGEYGATSMLAGNIPRRTATISQRIAMVIQDQDYGTAGFWVVVMVVMAFLLLLVIQRPNRR